MARLEYRRNWWDADPDSDVFPLPDQVGRGDDDQDVGILEISYVFD